MKRYVAILALLVGVIPAAHADALPARFIITGSGYGHGVGLSQIGAKGLALEGKSAIDIAQYYFPGTLIDTSVAASTIRVNVAHQATYVSIALSTTGISQRIDLMSGSDSTTAINAQSGTSRQTFRFSIVGQKISAVMAPFEKGIPTTVYPAQSLFTLYWNSSNLSRVLLKSSTGNIELKYGKIQLRAVAMNGGSFRIEVTNTLKVDTEYVYGISEMSSSWPSSALQVQAIASRTYGIARLGSMKKECDCNLYSSKYDQVFTGYAKESEVKYGALWKAAVDQTAGQFITYGHKVISVYFSSSTGGTTQRSQDVWGTSFPYLTNVPDPWSLDIVLNPNYSHWQRVLNQSDVIIAFSLPDVATLKIDSRTVTNSALTVTATSSSGTSQQLPIGVFKSKLLIPSSWFEIAAGY